MKKQVQAHFEILNTKYDQVGEKTWVHSDLLKGNLEQSLDLFEPESLVLHSPRPKALEVVALLSGVHFDPLFIQGLTTFQSNIKAIIGDSLSYWVAPHNLGLEYCVFKWPDQTLSYDQMLYIKSCLRTIRTDQFTLDVNGIQINPDGCVVARGFDSNRTLFNTRAKVSQSVPFLPSRQSGWCHVPLGRILQPIGSNLFKLLKDYICSTRHETPLWTDINSFKLIHETRWYMEEKTILENFPFN